ncbi:type II toxin-antitoxin system HipA family toxin [Dickeya solani]|uniref:HipA domain protein n=1 Tax=Dickeya solani D s0432-1 TaxID=1231725 RepID=A0AAV3KB60_9GAMM|nr:type II toxin-antitoxin system HipA family toxin [Dickeya solani]ANE75336.1 phosphatidylinositol kinase [Dickeya solani IPO 2222]AUC42739.1 HIPA protein [Dickeya solani RNS 08.23.3.1.A]AUH09250.1 phosphatidylinositol kinase [Dickeya solani D s0432-1]AUH13222.1 phosphatidylinositol kinase [Dickeya solani]AYQ49883.1 putative DNA-binding transcriptional regulator [Dickeya solani]
MLSVPLDVIRRLSDGRDDRVGQLAENRQGVYFQYDADYLASHTSSLGPFNLAFNNQLQAAPRQLHYGLHGIFGDSLPDGWGLYLMDRFFRQQGYNPARITALERLAFIGHRGPGALRYEPAMSRPDGVGEEAIELIQLGHAAVEEFEGTESSLIAHLMNAGGSGGARPKLSVTKKPDGTFTTRQDTAGDKLLVKLTSEKFALQHAESQIEYLYMKIARQAGIDVADFELLPVGEGRYWLQQSRFDCVGETGRLHMVSASGLLDASFRAPSLDYVDLIKATRLLCGVTEARKLLHRALFNYLLVNQDDHAKNFSFLADDRDNWRLSPFYDVVYSPSPQGEHMTAFNGHGSRITLSTMEQLAGQAGLSKAKAVLDMADELYDVAKGFHREASHFNLPAPLITTIQREIDSKWRQLRE